MLKNLRLFLQEKTPCYIEKPLKEIEHTCCTTSYIKVLDFDTIKDNFTKLIGINESMKLRSVDAIYFHKRKNALCLVEMKRFGKNDPSSKIEIVKERLKEMPYKLVDSVLILIAIMGYYSIDKELYYGILHPSNLRIEPYMLVDIPYKDLLPIQLALQDQLNISLSKRIENNISIISCEEFENNVTK